MNEKEYERLRADQSFTDRYRRDKKLYPKLFGCAILLFILLLVCLAILPKSICWMVAVCLFQGSLTLYAIACGLQSYIAEFERFDKGRE